MATAYSVLANGWVYIRPNIVKTISYSDGRTVNNKPEKLRRVVAERTSKIVTSMLVDWVNTWAAKNGRVEWYAIAGKTGTAQISYRWVYEKWVWGTNASFAGYGPAEEPKFVIIVKLERPRINEYGWQTSAFIFSEAAGYLLDYYGIPKKQ
jgi:cell division protein FtsI/penicillin-binding protein 2